MRQLVGQDIGAYTFNAAAKTVTITGFETLQLEDILLITNVTDNVIIYQFNNPSKGGSISGNVITLTFDTTSMSNSDSLQIWVDYSQLLTMPLNVRDIVKTIQMTGKYQGKAAYAFNLLGRRAGFTSTTAMDGVKEYDNGVSNFAATSNSTLDIISSSVNDAAAGTGVRTVKVVYLDNSNNLIESAAITLNGTTLVTSVLTGVNQVLWMETNTVGTGGVAQGNIRLRINGGVVEVEQITAGGNKSRSAIFKVPSGYTGYIVSWNASAINNDQDVRLRATVNSLDRSFTSMFKFQSELYVPLNTSHPDTTDLWLKIPELATMKVNTISGGTAAAVKCMVNILFVIIQN